MLSAIIMMIFGYLYTELILTSGNLGFGVTLFTALFMGALVYLQRSKQLPHSRDSLIYLGLILLTAAYFTLFNNSELEIFALLLLQLLVGYYIATISGLRMEARLSSYLPFDLLSTLIIRPVVNLFSGPRALCSGTKDTRNIRGVLLLLAGAALAIPPCIIISYMLQEADAAFFSLWHRLTGAILTDALLENLWQFFLSLPIACYFFGLVYGDKEPLYSRAEVDIIARRVKFVPGLLAIGGITPILLIYAIFFCSQSAYFLSAFSGLLPEGYIYSDYARRGFFELCRVSSLNFAIILALGMFCNKEGGRGRIYRLYTVALSLSSIALIIISLSKMLLYIQIYGLTPLRVYTSWFMIMLALVFIFIMVKAYRPDFNGMKWSSLMAVTMFLLLCFADPDTFIAKYNERAYAEGRIEQMYERPAVENSDDWRSFNLAQWRVL